MTKKTTRTSMNPQKANYIFDRVEALSNTREAWEKGAYKASNEQLYDLLGECLEFYLFLKGDTKKNKVLNDYLRSRSNTFRENASLETRIVRAVFNSDFQKRAYAYAKVIRIASKDKPKDESMSSFISRFGGVEEIRRTTNDGTSASLKRRENINYAKQCFISSKPLAASIKVQAPTRKIDDGAEHNLFVALMRQEANGEYSMVFETSSVSVVNTALEQAGKERGAAEKRDHVGRQISKQGRAAANAVEAAAAKIEHAQ